MAPEGYIGTILKPLPEGDFVTKYLVTQGPFRGLEFDFVEVVAMPIIVRIQKLEKIKEQLPANATKAQANEIIQELLEGDTYVHDELPETLANGFVSLYQQQLVENKSLLDLSYAENCTIDAVQTHHKNFYKEEFEGGDHLEIGNLVKAFKTKSGRKMITRWSLFLAFSPEKQNITVRMNTMDSNILTDNLCASIGLVTNGDDPEFQHHHMEMQGYQVALKMALQGNKNNPTVWLRGAAMNALSEGHLKYKIMRHVVITIAQMIGPNAGMNVYEFMYLQLSMEAHQFLTLLKAYGIEIGKDLNNPCASFPTRSFTCGGTPETPNFEVQQCQFVGRPEGCTFCMYGGKATKPEGIVFYGRTFCYGCYLLA